MNSGPYEFILIVFPGNRFNGRIVPALRELVENGTIHIIDLVFLKKDAAGDVQTFELSSLEHDEVAEFDELDGEIDSLLSLEDIQIAARDMPANSSAGLLVWENVWAARFAEAVRAADGQVIANQRIDGAFVEAALKAEGIEL